MKNIAVHLVMVSMNFLFNGARVFQPAELLARSSMCSRILGRDGSPNRPRRSRRERPTFILWIGMAFGIILLLANSSEAAEGIVFDGILGNSGEKGDSLVTTSKTGNPRDTFGSVLDRAGTIWASAGSGRINRYSLDGRLLASFKAPAANNRSMMTIVNDTIVIMADRDCKLYKLDVNAEPGSSPVPMNIKNVDEISFGSKDGKIAYVTADSNLFQLDVKSGESKQLGPTGEGRCNGVEMTPDGKIFLNMDGKMYAFENGKIMNEKKGPPAPGSRPQYIDGFWYGHVWHGTIKKFQKDFESTPGVVYGGASGSFIGKVRCNEELSSGKSLWKIGPNLFVTSGIGDVVFILEWNEEKKQFSEVRRIGALSWHKDGIIMDDEGDILVRNGRWHWNDRPDSPFYETTSFRINGQLSMTPDKNIVGPGLVYDSAIAWVRGRMDDVGGVQQRWIEKVTLRKEMSGTAVYLSKDKKRCVLTIDRKGEGILYYVDGKWTPMEDKPVKLATAQTTMDWNNLAMPDNSSLIASADGNIIEFIADGDNWKEVKRWNSWGDKPDQKFGKTLYISLHNNLLWVSDTERHRVLCFKKDGNAFVGQFGKTDKPGTGLDELSRPTGISSRGSKAALIDADNERVMKLVLK